MNLRAALPTVFLLPLLWLLVLPGCESLGLKAHITSVKSVNGKTEVKHREAKNWAEFESAMAEVGTDFSDVAKEVGSTTTKLVKALVDAPPPGKVRLRDLDGSLAKFEGNEKLDFLAAARKKSDAEYDFTYVQIGVASYDRFFKTAAEVYALAFQMKETARRIRLASAALTGEEPDENATVDGIAEKARQIHPESNTREMAAYFRELDTLWKLVGTQGSQLVTKTAELVAQGQALVVGAPASITNPKTVLHLSLILEGLEQSINLIKDSATIITELA